MQKSINFSLFKTCLPCSARNLKCTLSFGRLYIYLPGPGSGCEIVGLHYLQVVRDYSTFCIWLLFWFLDLNFAWQIRLFANHGFGVKEYNFFGLALFCTLPLGHRIFNLTWNHNIREHLGSWWYLAPFFLHRFSAPWCNKLFSASPACNPFCSSHVMHSHTLYTRTHTRHKGQ